jgi:hypothetical protein
MVFIIVSIQLHVKSAQCLQLAGNARISQAQPCRKTTPGSAPHWRA